MKFSKKMEEIKNREENKGKVVLVRCGIFVIAIGNDAMLLHKIFGLKVTCFKESVCKVGIPVSYALKYLDMIEEKGYSYVLYDYDKETKELIDKYKYEGQSNEEQEKCIECKKCEHYSENNVYNTSNLFDIIEKRKAEK